jgi:2-polyprenyl-6-hydroxyphenyl methylase/3-demethylubiquinone-9 3-methyltransferase
MGEAPLSVARLHGLESGVQVDYQKITVEELARDPQHAGQYDVVTCLEMLEHVPDPGSVIRACASLLKPGGHLFVSTINRNPKSFLFAIIGAEYVLSLLPKGTHEWKKFIRPSEMSDHLRNVGLDIRELTGMTYNLLTKVYKLGRNVDVNYMMHAKDTREA